MKSRCVVDADKGDLRLSRQKSSGVGAWGPVPLFLCVRFPYLSFPAALIAALRCFGESDCREVRCFRCIPPAFLSEQ